VTVVYLARHGQTAYNHEARFQGHAPVPLDATGREQAAELAERVAALGPLRTFICSPLERARETAAIVGARIGMTATEDARFAETDVGDWEHRTYAEIGAEDPAGLEAFLRTDAAFAFPGGESYADHLARVEDGLADLFADPEGLPALVVCHGGVLRLALAARGDESAREWKMANTALVTLHADGRVEGR
jgi:broad specificity phosphatase PhoE